LGAIGIFVYVGAEVAIGQLYGELPKPANIGNLTEKVAAGYLSFYWGGAMWADLLAPRFSKRFLPERPWARPQLHLPFWSAFPC